MRKVCRMGNSRDFQARLRRMAVNMIVRVVPLEAENIRWLGGPVYVGGEIPLYTGTFEDVQTGNLWRFTYYYHDRGRYVVERIRFDA